MISNEKAPSSAIARITKRLLGRRSDWIPDLAPPPGLRNLFGPLLVLVTFAVSAIPFLGMINQPGNDALGLLVGTESIVAMAWTFVLAVRTGWSEHLFGGLDRVYVAHRWLGVISVVLMWWHIQSSNNVTGIAGADPAAAELGTTLAGVAEPTLYILVIASIVRWLPWRLWRLTHKLLIIPFVFAAYHMLTAEKPFANLSGWGLWFGFVVAAGCLSYVLRVIGRNIIWRGSSYQVTEVIPHPDAVEIVMTPRGRPLRWQPGQFAFVKFQVRGASEPHPFSIAAAPGSGNLRFMVRRLGDWTDRLADFAKPGNRVFVEGPYGHLRVLPAQSRRTVWVAGGVGITPFLSALPLLTGDEPPILFHAVRDENDAHAREEIEAAAKQGRLVVHYFGSAQNRRLTAESMASVLGSDGLQDAHVVVCGPAKLTRWVTRFARRAGAKRVESEIFDLRGGIAPDLSRAISANLDATPSLRRLSESRLWLRTGQLED